MNENLTDNNHVLVAHGSSESNNQVTLSFQGQVYMFDSVLPEKVIFCSCAQIINSVLFSTSI